MRLAALLSLFALSLLISVNAGGAGTPCLVCTLVLALVDEGAFSAFDAAKATADPETFCKRDRQCMDMVERGFLTAITASQSPDKTCQDLTLCKDPTCNLFGNTWPVTPQGAKPDPSHLPYPTSSMRDRPSAPPASSSSSSSTSSASARRLSADDAASRLAAIASTLGAVSEAGDLLENEGTPFYRVARLLMTAALSHHNNNPSVAPLMLDPCGLNITCIVHRVFDQHLPFDDSDGDLFAPSAHDGIFDAGLRGGDWRGRDCNDKDATIYPGRKVSSHDPSVDHDCNGIFGTDPTTGKSYEELYCDGTERRGVTILGDSAAAHFHIPPAWFRGKDWNLDHLLPAAADELDWPECSWSTGFANSSACPAAAFSMESMYQRVRARNLCAHRDFQNIGVNGARVTSMAPPGIIEGFSRNQATDHPSLVFFALIGNDVCNGHPGLSHMTTPSEFNASVVASLQHLDTVLPAGSSVVFIPLVDGRVLWNTMHDQVHPIGVKYPAIYEFLACSGDTPCWGWMNTNETWRNATTARAEQLNDVYTAILKTYKFKNFEMYYNDMDWNVYIQQYISIGGNAVDLIEPVDGFHPSQTGQMWMAYNIHSYLDKHFGEKVLGPINPNNAAIKAKFGDQGGYK